MLRRFIFSSLAVMALMAPLSAQTVDEIIAKHVQAVGGADKLKTVHSVRLSGKMTAGGFEAGISEAKKRPGMVRQEFTLQGMTAVQAYDGKNGWQIDPFQGKKTAEAMSEDDLKAIKEESDFDDWAAVGPIVDYKSKGNQVELVGKEDVEGTPTYKLKVTLKSGDVRYVYLDAENYVAIKQESKRTIRGAEREFETSIGDYKEEGGIMMAHSAESKPKGAPQGQKITIDKVEINPDMPDSFFQMPAAAPAAEKPSTTEKKEPATPEKKKTETTKPKQ